MRKKVILGIDFNNIFFSSFYGQPLINQHGENVNAINGFFFRLKIMKEVWNPDYLFMANDMGRDKTFRRKMYQPYKAHRKAMDPDVINQIKHGYHLTALLGFPMIGNELYEADDILGMVSRFATEKDMIMVIASTDKDLYQLINDNVYIYSPRRKEVIDLEYMSREYKLTPAQWIEYKMLLGDKSDNVPGVDFVGPATALKLMQRYHSIDNIYQNLRYLQPQLQDGLLVAKEHLPFARSLITVLTDYTLIDFNLNMLDNIGRYPREVHEVLDKLGLRALHNVVDNTLLRERREDDEEDYAS